MPLDTGSRGASTIGPHAALELRAGSAATGRINFDGGGGRLLIAAGVTPQATIGHLRAGDVIAVAGIDSGTIAVAGTLLTLSSPGGTLSLTLDARYGGQFEAAYTTDEAGLDPPPTGSRSRTRTYDPAVNSRLLYQLSYPGSAGRTL